MRCTRRRRPKSSLGAEWTRAVAWILARRDPPRHTLNLADLGWSGPSGKTCPYPFLSKTASAARQEAAARLLESVQTRLPLDDRGAGPKRLRRPSVLGSRHDYPGRRHPSRQNSGHTPQGCVSSQETNWLDGARVFLVMMQAGCRRLLDHPRVATRVPRGACFRGRTKKLAGRLSRRARS